MNRGQYWGIGWLKRIWHAALSSAMLCAGLAGVASATNGLKATPQPDRSWESYYGVTILPSGRTVVVGDKGVIMTTDDGGRTWARQILKKGPKYYDLYSVGFSPDGSRGWVVVGGSAFLGLVVAWLFFFYLGQLLLSIPTSFHAQAEESPLESGLAGVTSAHTFQFHAQS